LLIVSHITSPTALIMPVAAICAEARRRGIAVCVDGPHAPSHVPLNLDELDCDFYTASCHKWLAATLGTGFLYVHPKWHEQIEPQQLSWGRLLPNLPERWFEEFIWSGTRDFSGYLSIPVAIDFMNSVGVEAFQARVRAMSAETTRQLIELTGRQPIGVDTALWYGAMSHVPLPDGDWSHLQQWLWDEHRIEVPIINFESDWFVRVSHHLYTMRSDVDHLISALRVQMT
jgi:isopenicillin-N epimerase